MPLYVLFYALINAPSKKYLKIARRCVNKMIILKRLSPGRNDYFEPFPSLSALTVTVEHIIERYK